MRANATPRAFSLSIITALISPLASALAFTAIASPAAAQSLPPLPIQFSPDRVITQGREGSASGVCAESRRPLRAIAYTDPRSQTAVSARTAQAQPTLWVYLPVPISEETEASFVLKNSLNAPLYEGALSGQTDSTGIIGISLSDIPLSIDLAVGDAYQWSLSVTCAENETAVVSGWIERRLLDSSLRPTFEAVGSRNRAALYANYGYLQDTLSELAALRLANPDNEAIAQDWSNFLSALNLSELASEPVLECCQIGKEREDSAGEEINEEINEERNEDTERPVDSELEENEASDVEQPEGADERSEEGAESLEEETPEAAPEEDGRSILQRARDKG